MNRVAAVAIAFIALCAPAQAATIDKLVSDARLADHPLTIAQARQASMNLLRDMPVAVDHPRYSVFHCRRVVRRSTRAINCWGSISTILECEFVQGMDLLAPCPPELVTRVRRTYAIWVTGAYGRTVARERWSSDEPR